MTTIAGPAAVIERLADAINRHDLDGIMACFSDDVLAEHPARPDRDFRGLEQMRIGWAIQLDNLVGLRAELIRSCVSEDTVWVEWCWRATRVDGSQFDRAGVVIHGVRDGVIVWTRLHMELIEGEPRPAPPPSRRSSL
jgi:ketosteroid isomerase-like protein